MSYITADNLNVINAEMTNWCNAGCPMCQRFDWDLNLVKGVTNTKHTTLKLIKEKIGPKIISQLKGFFSNGIVGDAIMNPECLEIFEYVKSKGTCDLTLHTNGGARNKEIWRDLAKIPVYVVFAIDGLEDTNHLYRVNSNFNRIIANVNTYIKHLLASFLLTF